MGTSGPRHLRRGRMCLLAVVLLVLIGVLSQSWVALFVLVVYGIDALAILAAGGLGGLWLVAAVGAGRWPWRWQVLLGAALGTGSLCILVLVFGLLGWLHAALWYAVLIMLAIAGLVRLAILRRRPTPPAAESAGRWCWLWLIACPFVGLGILGASIPPGVLWAEEGSGYDVLEYHLQMPKEYFEAGRITYAPHNVYANFPSNVEMLYLLCMVLRGDAIEAAATAKMLNLAFAMLTVAAGWLVGRERSPTAGVVTGVVTASFGWLVYLSGVAYVENAMLWFGLMALAVLVRATGSGDRPPSVRCMVLSGLLAGLASGCKYPAIVLIAAPLLVVVAGLNWPSLRTRLAGALVYGLAATAAVSPWLIKNLAMTDNPVFPLAGTVFTHYPQGWGAQEATHFAASHRPAPGEGSLAGRLGYLWNHVPADPSQRFGPLILLLPVVGLVFGQRRRIDRLCWLLLATQIFVWMFTTHLYARFAIPFAIPLIALASDAVAVPRFPRTRAVLPFLVVAGGLFNATFAARLYAEHVYADGRKIPIEGATGVFVDGRVRGYEFYGAVNNELLPEARILLVGEARTFYFRRSVAGCVVFNRNPFVEAVRTARTDTDVIEWLRARGYTHVLVNWREIRRLRRSRYGFPEEVTPALFTRLMAAGLVHVKTITDSVNGAPYADLFAVPPGLPTSAAGQVGGSTRRRTEQAET